MSGSLGTRPPSIVLGGAGISVAPPAAVPSWWGFNQAVLTELRRRFLGEHSAPKRAAPALARLSLDDLDVAEFSQLVSNAFAGGTWFEVLSVLDGATPNINHKTLASWAREGSLQAVVTTNFDTLTERALESVAVPFRAYDALVDEVPHSSESSFKVVKLHGSAPRRATLVDLAAQKRRGLPPQWQDWLEWNFASSRVIVAGFSGADLALGDDYLRLKASSSRTPHLSWLVRPGQKPASEAEAVMRLLGRRGGFVEGVLPDAWPSLGAPDVARSTNDVRVDDAEPDVSAAIAAWLSHPMVDADTCGLAMTRLLDAAGNKSAAQSLRTSILTRVRRRLRVGLNVTGVTRAALQIGQLAGDEPFARAEKAVYCLGLAARAFDAVLLHLPNEARELESLRLELAHNKATILSNIARFEILRGRLGEASNALQEAAQHSQALNGVRRLDHNSSEMELAGAIAYFSHDQNHARLLWEDAHALALRTGNGYRAESIRANLDLMDRGAALRLPTTAD